MAHSLAFGLPSPFEILILDVLALLIVGPIFLLLVVLSIRSGRAKARAAFPMIAAAADDGPGSYRVSGVDKQTRADRNVTVQAESRANAQVKAELDGIIVTHVDKTP